MKQNNEKIKKDGCVFLIGFMASGKTTVGKNLAKKLELPFLDTDKMIVDREGMSIAEIFEKYGEPYFRDLETKVVAELVEKPQNAIISVGGGLPVREENRVLMRQAGTVVYLNASAQTLLNRLRGDKKRPLVAGCKDDKELKDRIDTLMNAREALYLDAADLIIHTENGSVTQVSAMIIEQLSSEKE